MKYLFFVISMLFVLSTMAQTKTATSKPEQPLATTSVVVEVDSGLYMQIDSAFYKDKTHVVEHKPINDSLLTERIAVNINNAINGEVNGYMAIFNAQAKARSFFDILLPLLGDTYTGYMKNIMAPAFKGNWQVQVVQGQGSKVEAIEFDDQMQGFAAENKDKKRFEITALSTKKIVLEDQLNGRTYQLYNIRPNYFQGGGIYGQPLVTMLKL